MAGLGTRLPRGNDIAQRALELLASLSVLVMERGWFGSPHPRDVADLEALLEPKTEQLDSPHSTLPDLASAHGLQFASLPHDGVSPRSIEDL